MLLSLAIEAKNIIVENRAATVALCSLWTPVGYLRDRIDKAYPELLGPDSKIALIGGLYGGGLNVMLRNLHHNPQIDTLILCGKDFSGASDHLKLFLEGKVRLTGQKQAYVFEDGHSEDLEKMVIDGPGASYTMDSLLKPEMFLERPRAIDLTGSITPEILAEIKAALADYRPWAKPNGTRPDPVPLPKPKVDLYPSDPFGHSVTAETIVEAWSEILVRLHRFGQPVRLRNGKERLELMNFKAVIENPALIGERDLALLNVTRDKLSEYQGQLLSPDLDHGMPYTYGNRLRRYFGPDFLDWAAGDLAKAGDSRHAYAALWDNLADPDGHDSPCLVSVFFRKVQNKVHLVAQFRSHNGARAWPVNCVGLQGLMKRVCEMANARPDRTEEFELSPGRLTVVSLSLSLDPADLPQVLSTVEARLGRAHKTKTDPNGFFRITVDHNQKLIIVYHHAPDGELLTEYSGQTPSELGWRLAKVQAFSDPYHALYLGGQLERAWRALTNHTEYVQDKSLPND
ncbi:MAG: hypothetical protein LBJ61_10525 [Deltaproteobacteria bacterium]|jgi:thymidylate synthase|nr:hypothetical protein [Deltaproteobacteria bacterium]